MNTRSLHSFHIPVLGLGYSIDTPVKVARFGISSVISIMDDHLVEKMRAYYCTQTGRDYVAIGTHEDDYRARRITAYLNLVYSMVQEQIIALKLLSFEEENDLTLYFDLLPDKLPLKELYLQMKETSEGVEKEALGKVLKNSITVGAVDVNIMAKVDKLGKDGNGEILPEEYSDALSAFRGFAKSDLSSSVVFSAGYNPRLYNYIEQFPDFVPDKNGIIKKKIILKVSDYRSALVQGKIFAKKGLWVSEFRIESGLNCGGHAFPTDGLLLGPILEEFKIKREGFTAELYELYRVALSEKNITNSGKVPPIRITVQGGIGTSREHDFLLTHYALDATGWGSPFLLVPEATNVDEATISELANAKASDYYMSYASPLGIAFNNFKRSSAQKQRQERIAKGRPGSPCYKKFLASNTEFTETPICTASREYQNHKINQLKERQLSAEEYVREFEAITEKDCLCEGLGSSVLLKDHIPLSHNLSAVTICPGPNLAYFSGVFSLKEMVSHIYGRINILNSGNRPNLFINELNLYIDYFKKKCESGFDFNPKQVKNLEVFRSNLLAGIEYYKGIVSEIKNESSQYIAKMRDELELAAAAIGMPKFAMALTHENSFAHTKPE